MRADADVTKATRSPGQTAVGRGAVTALGTAVVSVGAVVAGAVLAREFGRTVETDGLFAAYAVYLVLVLAAQAVRVVLLPRLTRAEAVGRLAGELRAQVLALGVVAVPALVVAFAAAEPLGDALTGGLPTRAGDVAADSLAWMVLGGVLQLYAGLAASALAARDSYVVAAAAYALGAAAGLAYFLVRLDGGPVALAEGLALNGAVTLAIPLVALVVRGGLGSGGVGGGLAPRLWELARGVALPLALQGLFVIAVRFAGDEGVGAVTTLSYAYFVVAFLVAVTASSLALISSVPLTRAGLSAGRAATHVVSTTWVSVTIVAAAAGVFVLAGEPIARGVLGSAFSGDVGEELGHLVAYLSPWMVVSIGVSVTFPLLFVVERDRLLPLIALVAIGVQIPVELVLQRFWGLSGVAVGIALTTLLVLAALLLLLSKDTVVLTAEGVATVTVLIGAAAAAAFGLAAVALDGLAAAVIGLVAYVAVLLVWRPRGLREAWDYVRSLT
jgi:O-antigen/teichoic acid export membrane protein